MYGDDDGDGGDDNNGENGSGGNIGNDDGTRLVQHDGGNGGTSIESLIT